MCLIDEELTSILSSGLAPIQCQATVCISDDQVPRLRYTSGIVLYKRPANERGRYIVTSSLIGWAHTQNDPYIHLLYASIADFIIP